MTLPNGLLRECLAAAIAAPSVHNTQPWLFRLRDGGVDVYADRGRQVPVIDPDGRELVISVGAAVFNLRVAMLALGRTPILLPLSGTRRPSLLARVVPGSARAVSPTATALAAQIPVRRSNRWPFTGQALPAGLVDELVAAAAAEGAVLKIAGRGLSATVIDLVRVAEVTSRNDPAYRTELAAWTVGRDRTDGVPAAVFGPLSGLLGLPLRDFGLAQPGPRPVADFETRPTVAVLYARDTPAQWLRAGQALQRVLLTATVRGVSTTLMTQPLENPTLRDRLTGVAGRPQVILRLGYAQHAVARTPRRPLGDVVSG
jgi:nitroreductase